MITSHSSAHQIIDEFEYGEDPKFGLGPDDIIPNDPQEDETQPGKDGNNEDEATSTKAKSKQKLFTV